MLVTGMGALIGQGIVAGLRSDGRARVIGLDRRISDHGASLCDAFVVKPDCDEADPAYLAFWQDLIVNEGVDLVLPGISADMDFLDANRERLSPLGVRLGLNTARLIRETRDKLEFFRLLECADLPRIESRQPASWSEALATFGDPPFMFKPRSGEGGQGQAVIRTERDFAYWTSRANDNWLMQPFVGSDDAEFTVGAFGLGDGAFLDEMIIMRRWLTRAGNTGRAEITDAPNVEAAARALMKHFCPEGPTNLQFRLDNGVPRLLEINPRFSSSCSLRVAFGFNEAAMSIDHYLLRRRPQVGPIRRGRAERYSADHVVYG